MKKMMLLIGGLWIATAFVWICLVKGGSRVETVTVNP